MRWLFDKEGEEEAAPADPGERLACNEETLLAFIRGLGRSPTLAECKHKFGGILGPLVIGWRLKAKGLIGGKNP